jgi:hypothetical protein
MNDILIREYSWWSTHRKERTVGAFGLFVMTTILIGVLIVCYTNKKTSMSFFLCIGHFSETQLTLRRTLFLQIFEFEKTR